MGNFIRAALPADKSEWLRMRLALWPDADPHQEEEQIAYYLGGESPTLPTLQMVFVAPRPDQGLCGFAELSIRPYADGCETQNVGYLEAWYVDRDMRRQGIGQALVQAAEEWALAQGCQEMGSDSDIYNVISREAHLNLGYEEVGRVVQFCKKLQ